MNRTPHLDRHYEQELLALDAQLARCAARADDMLRAAVEAMVDLDADAARAVVELDEALDALEVATDDSCLKLLARRAPVGADLRLVTTALKVVVDFERVGDLAVNIAKRTLGLVRSGAPSPSPEVVKLAYGTIDLFGRAIRSLRDRDAELARAVRAEDRRLDDLNKQVFHRSIAHAKANPGDLEAVFDYTSIARQLERAGDHAANVAEMVVFLVDGTVLRHAADEG